MTPSYPSPLAWALSAVSPPSSGTKALAAPATESTKFGMNTGTTSLINRWASSESGGAANAASSSSIVHAELKSPQPSSACWGSRARKASCPMPVVDRPGVVEQSLGPVDRGKRRVGVLATHVLDVPTEDRRLEALGTDQVVGHEHEAAGVEPAVPGDGVGQLRSRPGRDVAVEQGMEHGHEVALARAERSVQIAGLRPVLRQRRPDETQRLVEGDPQLRRDDVGVQGGLDVLHALGEAQHEVTLVDLLRDADELAQQRLPGLHRSGRHRRVPPRRPRRCDSSAVIAVAGTGGDHHSPARSPARDSRIWHQAVGERLGRRRYAIVRTRSIERVQDHDGHRLTW